MLRRLGPNGNQDGRFGLDQELVETAPDMASHAIKAKVKCTCAGAEETRRFSEMEGLPTKVGQVKARRGKTPTRGGRKPSLEQGWLLAIRK